jgi:hypothetical protein
MPRAPKEVRKPVGHPLKEIDWNVVDDYLITGCPGTKIAAAIGICNDTLYARCEMEKGMCFSAYSQEKRKVGEAILHKAQFDKAIGRTELGDNTLLIFLGKTRLDQKESQEISVAPETVEVFKTVMNQLDELQSKVHSKTERDAEDSTLPEVDRPLND